MLELADKNTKSYYNKISDVYNLTRAMENTKRTQIKLLDEKYSDVGHI